MAASAYAKAIVGGLFAGLGTLLLATSADSAAGTGITSSEWIKTAIAVVAVFAAVWGVPNSIPSITETPPSLPTAPPNYPEVH